MVPLPVGYVAETTPVPVPEHFFLRRRVGFEGATVEEEESGAR